MRILFVHSIGKKKYGGGERWVIKAASGLLSRGHTVFVAGRRDSILLHEAEKHGVNTLSINIYSDLSIYQAWRLSGFLKKNKIDVVVSKGRDLFVSGLASRWAGHPVVFRRSSSPPRGKKWKHLLLTRWLADGVFTNTLTIADFYKKNGFSSGDFFRVIYNGLEINEQEKRFDYSKAYPGKKIMLSIGRLVAAKGYFFLIDALAQIKETHPELMLFVLGDGKDKSKLIRYSRKRGVAHMIHFDGYQSHPVPYIKGCDFFVHVSLYEGMPNAAMEAMAYGKAVILSRVNGADELSAKGTHAWLIPPGDHEAIAKAIMYAAKNPEECKEMGYKAMQFVRQTFGMQTMISQLEAFFLVKMKEKESMLEALKAKGA